MMMQNTESASSSFRGSEYLDLWQCSSQTSPAHTPSENNELLNLEVRIIITFVTLVYLYLTII